MWCPCFLFFFGEQIVNLIQNRVSIYGYEETVRGLLYKKYAIIAFDYFPFGSGAGTFSSQPSRGMYYSPLYYEYDISHYYGTTPDNSSFLMDVGWSKFIAEAGWIGGGAYALSYIFVFVVLFKSMIRKPSVVNVFGVLLGGLVFSSALGQSIFTAELGILLCALLFFSYYLDVVRSGRRAL